MSTIVSARRARTAALIAAALAALACGGTASPTAPGVAPVASTSAPSVDPSDAGVSINDRLSSPTSHTAIYEDAGAATLPNTIVTPRRPTLGYALASGRIVDSIPASK